MRHLFLLLVPFFLWAFELPDLTYPGASPSSKLKHERYDRLEYYVKGEGYKKVYGETHAQDFKHPDSIGKDYEQKVKAFVAKQLGIDVALFDGRFAHFEKDGESYYLQVASYNRSYSYVLLHVAPCPDVVTLPVEGNYDLTPSKTLSFPKHPLLPNVKGFVISSAKYFTFDEATFYYDKGGHKHEGQYWNIDYKKTADDSDSYRYIVANDYKKKLFSLGGTILKDEDNSFTFRLGDSIAKFAGYNGTFSLQIIQEEAFKQSLVLTPDAIKVELDKAGKVTLDGIYFDFDKATLKSESQKAILSTVALLERYPDLTLSIHGHTDNKGSDTYNAKLSSDRAAAVMHAIIAQGIDASRLSSKGHGEEDPVATNDTDEGRAQNRRVELHKESGGDKKSVITIDFIKPIEGSVITGNRTYQDGALGIQYTKPYSKDKRYVEYKGTHKYISYEIMKDGKLNKSFSRKAIIKNYANILELYNAKIVGEYSNTLYFEIADRGDGKKVYGRIEGYSGSYSIRFLIME
jgi:OmpA-OmpF porin, OOP family